MTINERVKHFRKDVLHISQTEFAVSLGMKQTGVSYMERDGSTVTDQTIKAICLLYNVNEEEIKQLNLKYTKIHNGFKIEIPNTSFATKLIYNYPELFQDYEIIKGKMDDVFLQVTGQNLTGEKK